MTLAVRASRGAALRRAQVVVIGALVVWVLIHTVLVWSTGWSAWRLGGLAMYGEPEFPYRGAAVVACGTRTCVIERRNPARFASEEAHALPVYRADSRLPEGYELVAAPAPSGDPQNEQLRFIRFPTPGNAEELVRFLLPRPCNSYLVVHYRQRVSLLSGTASLDTRPFVLEFPPCR